MDSTTPAPPKTDPRDHKRFYFTDTPHRRALVALARSIFKLAMTMDVSGLEYFPRQGSGGLAANHVTNFDVFPMQFALPRPIFFMGKAELFKKPQLDVFLRNLSGFPAPSTAARKTCGQCVMPQRYLRMGKRSGYSRKRSKGKGLAVAKTGAARLALDATCPIVPMAVVGSNQFFMRSPHRTQVQITILPLLLPKPGESALALIDPLMFALARALPETMRGVYAELPKGFTM